MKQKNLDERGTSGPIFEPQNLNTKRMWLGLGIVYGNTYTDYSLVEYDKIPPIGEFDLHFEEYKTFDDICENIEDLNDEIPSPIGNYFDCDDEDNIFYVDPEDDNINWFVEDNYVFVTCKNQVYQVADSIAEFLTRLEIENNIYLNIFDKKNTLTSKEKRYSKLIHTTFID